MSAVSPATAYQREKVAGRPCVFCGRNPVDPAHIAPRSLGGCNDPLCVIPVCRPCHRMLDSGSFDALPFLEPNYRPEMGHALEHLGLEGLRKRLLPSGYRNKVAA